MKYKFRAECVQDACIFFYKTIGLTENFEIIPQCSLLPAVEVEFDSDLTLTEIINEMKEITDGHVMWQTVKPIEEYTGKRD